MADCQATDHPPPESDHNHDDHHNHKPTETSSTFIPLSIHPTALLAGSSYLYFSPVPNTTSTTTPIVLGIDEAGRGPVLGPMVYAAFYLPSTLSTSLLRTQHKITDSKALLPCTRTAFVRTLSDSSTSLHQSCGWAVSVLSARDISASMLRPRAHNLNAQALDATVALVTGLLDRGVPLAEIYVDTVGPPDTYRNTLSRLFPSLAVTVAKKADSLYACVGAASVCAKVTRDAALETVWPAVGPNTQATGWGSGYPSDSTCQAWLRENMHPVFGWGRDCRHSWGTAVDLLRTRGVAVEWPVQDEGESSRVTDYFTSTGQDGQDGQDGNVGELAFWFGPPAGVGAF